VGDTTSEIELVKSRPFTMTWYAEKTDVKRAWHFLLTSKNFPPNKQFILGHNSNGNGLLKHFTGKIWRIDVALRDTRKIFSYSGICYY